MCRCYNSALLDRVRNKNMIPIEVYKIQNINLQKNARGSDNIRRTDKEVLDKNVIESIMHMADHCVVAFSDNNIPYIVPLILDTKITIYISIQLLKVKRSKF